MSTVDKLLRTCPESSKPTYRKMAARALENSRSAAIRLKCLDCVCWQPAEVTRCHLTDCPLWIYRNPRGDGDE